jgi:hypothetical protein
VRWNEPLRRCPPVRFKSQCLRDVPHGPDSFCPMDPQNLGCRSDTDHPSLPDGLQEARLLEFPTVDGAFGYLEVRGQSPVGRRLQEAQACYQKIDDCGVDLIKSNKRADAHNAALAGCRSSIWTAVIKPADK